MFARYILLSWQNRCSTDDRTLGGMFYELCDEMNELDWAVALQQLIEFLENALEKTNKKFKKFIISHYNNGLQDYLVISGRTCLVWAAKVELIINKSIFKDQEFLRSFFVNK